MFVVDFFQETPTAAEEKPATTEASALACFVVRAPFAHLHAMLQETCVFFSGTLPSGGVPAEPSATGAATAVADGSAGDPA